MTRIRLRHPYDGSPRAGQPMGPVIEAEPFQRTAADGPSPEPAFRWGKGWNEWAFTWNVEILYER